MEQVEQHEFGRVLKPFERELQPAYVRENFLRKVDVYRAKHPGSDPTGKSPSKGKKK